jgi:nucleoside-diphosphate-sugar epimerase
MNVVITGGAGFLGVALAKALLQAKRVAGGLISRLTLLDRVVPPGALLDDSRVAVATGDLVELLEQGRALPPDTDLVFHLAAAVSSECEADFDLGMRSNVRATHLLLEACRALCVASGKPPRLVFASSVAVFGGELPPVVQDNTLPQPQSSYGIQKFIGEQLVADYARKGFVDGRSVRLMTVSVRPGRPNGAASSFLSGIIREPLAGERAICPVSPDTVVALSSPANSVAGLIKAADVDADTWGSRTAMNLPALTVRVDDMLSSLQALAGLQAVQLIDWKPDATIQRIVGGWPSRIAATRAMAMGLVADASFDEVIKSYVKNHPGAVKQTL